MSFIEQFGGTWVSKCDQNDPDKLSLRKVMLEKMQVPDDAVEKIKAYFAAGGGPPKQTFSEDGGHYLLTHAIGEMKQKIRFSLDGAETTSPRGYDGKAIVVTATFVDGVFASTATVEGCPPIHISRKRVGDEIHLSEECDGVKSDDILVKV